MPPWSTCHLWQLVVDTSPWQISSSLKYALASAYSLADACQHRELCLLGPCILKMPLGIMRQVHAWSGAMKAPVHIATRQPYHGWATSHVVLCGLPGRAKACQFTDDVMSTWQVRACISSHLHLQPQSGVYDELHCRSRCLLEGRVPVNTCRKKEFQKSLKAA